MKFKLYVFLFRSFNYCIYIYIEIQKIQFGLVRMVTLVISVPASCFKITASHHGSDGYSDMLDKYHKVLAALFITSTQRTVVATRGLVLFVLFCKHLSCLLSVNGNGYFEPDSSKLILTAMSKQDHVSSFRNFYYFTMCKPIRKVNIEK